MKKHSNGMLIAVAMLLAGVANAALILDYDSGVAPTAGTTGAADPANEGWTALGSNATGADGMDSGNGGWRTQDYTSSGGWGYKHAFEAAEQTDLANNGWTMTWTVGLNADTYWASGSDRGDNWYTDDTSRQNNQAMTIGTGGYYYRLRHQFDANGNIVLSDPYGGGRTYQITSNNDAVANSNHTQPSNSVNFITYTLTSAAGASSATLTTSLGGDAVTVVGTASSYQFIFFGSESSAGYGSATWNEVSLESIPEPATLGLVGSAGALVLLLRRRLLL